MEDEAMAVLVTGAERRLLEPEVRRDPAALEDLLHESFREIGRSGRLWSRDELIEVMTGPDTVDLHSAVVTGEQVARVAPDLALLTYTLDADGMRSRRSSLWRIDGDRPRMLFHQGTPLGPHTG
ncbi:nuclear transport factor 2 family protein [Agromyces arachidis]|uniref:nuclear transport factor 2 family protein n=1 Tax=Agromyces arachidis TaxID=766966 RepID=UPI00405660F7